MARVRARKFMQAAVLPLLFISTLSPSSFFSRITYTGDSSCGQLNTMRHPNDAQQGASRDAVQGYALALRVRMDNLHVCRSTLLPRL